MRRHLSLFFILLLASGVFNCKNSVHISPEIKSQTEIVGLIPEMVLKGKYFGQFLNNPNGIESDNSGSIYLLDGGNNRIIKFDANLKPVRDAGGLGGSEGLLHGASSISLDNNLNIYIADTENKRISIYDRRLNYANMIDFSDPDDPVKFGYPIAAVLNRHAELWVSDVDNRRLAVFNNYDVFERFEAESEYYSRKILVPGSIDIDKEGNLFIADLEYGRVLEFDNFGAYLDEYDCEEMIAPSGCAFDSYNNIWVVDNEYEGLFCFSRNGEMIFSQQSMGDGGDYGFSGPLDLTILPGNRLALCDTGNNRVLIFKILYS